MQFNLPCVLLHVYPNTDHNCNSSNYFLKYSKIFVFFDSGSL